MAAAFRTNRVFLLSLTFAFFIQACAPETSKLPDDPDNEPVSVVDEGGDSVKDTPADVPSEVPGTGAPAETPVEDPVVTAPSEPETSEPESEQEAILKLYDHLDPDQVVPTQALQEAVLYYHNNKNRFPNNRVISILDFNQSSTQKRWHIVDLATGAVWSLHVAHGKGSDSNHDGFAEKFSNVSGSNATSIGFYKTAETYQGKHGYSLRLDGLSSTNSNARARAIVVHGATYVQDRNVIQGRSWGCPAISMTHYKTLIDRIKGGSLIYAVGGSTTKTLLGQR